MEEKLKAIVASYQQMLANEQLQRVSAEADLALSNRDLAQARAELSALQEQPVADLVE